MKVTVEELKGAIEKLPPFDTELPYPRLAMFLPDQVFVSKLNEPLSLVQYRQIIFEKDFLNECWTLELK